MTDLTMAQEEDMASWLEENELLYDKKLNAYKDFKTKDALLESKAASMGKDGYSTPLGPLPLSSSKNDVNSVCSILEMLDLHIG